MRALRVLMITARADYGGGPEHLYRLIAALPTDIQPFVACPHEAPYWERFVRQIGQQRLLAIPHRRFTLRHMVQLWRFVHTQRIDLIHSHGRGAGLYGRLLGALGRIPCVHTFHGLRIESHSLVLILERLLARLSRRLIAVSRGEAEALLAANLCPPARLRVIENGVRLPEHWLHDGPEPADTRLVITMSRFTYQKNPELLLLILEQLRRVKRLEEFHFLVLGTGPGQARVQTAIRRHGFTAQVTCRGAVANPQVYLQNAFCYLSTSRWEGMPLALLEAMALGIPVVATDVVGNRDVVDHERTGLLYGQSTPELAVQHLLRLATDATMWRRLSRTARRKAETHYSADRMARETAAVYREAHAKSASGYLRRGQQ